MQFQNKSEPQTKYTYKELNIHVALGFSEAGDTVENICFTPIIQLRQSKSFKKRKTGTNTINTEQSNNIYNISETNSLEPQLFTQENKCEDEFWVFLLLIWHLCFMFCKYFTLQSNSTILHVCSCYIICYIICCMFMSIIYVFIK